MGLERFPAPKPRIEIRDLDLTVLIELRLDTRGKREQMVSCLSSTLVHEERPWRQS